MSRVGIVRMRTPRRKRGLWDGEWKCAATARAKQIRVRKVAMGWTTRIEERECRVAEGREKSEESSLLPKRVSMQLVVSAGVLVAWTERTYWCHSLSVSRSKSRLLCCSIQIPRNPHLQTRPAGCL